MTRSRSLLSERRSLFIALSALLGEKRDMLLTNLAICTWRSPRPRPCPVLERIKDCNREMPKIPLVPGRHGEAMYPRGGGDHGVFGKDRRVAKTWRVHGEHLRGSFQVPGPHLNLIGLCRMEPAGDFDTSLDLSEGDRGEEACPTSRSLSQTSTPPCGFLLRTSETTLVSMR